MADHLTDAERPSEDADVGVDTHDDDIVDAARSHEVVGFAGVGDGIVWLDLQGVDLSSPGGAVLTGGCAVATIVAEIDGKARFVFAGECALARYGRTAGNRGRGLGELALGGSGIELHGVAGGVDDEDPFGAGGIEDLVHARGHLGNSSSGALAPVFIPHVTNDDGGFRGIPFFGADDGMESTASRRCLDACPGVESERLS